MPPKEPPACFNMARSKLLVSGAKDTSSLHRWVLLKNSIVRSTSMSSLGGQSTDSLEEVDTSADDEPDSFMFPDAGKFADSPSSGSSQAEAQWLDTLLSELQENDEEIAIDNDVSASTTPLDDDDEGFLTPLFSPMSSAEDLTSSSPPSYYTYPVVPYPPYNPLSSVDSSFQPKADRPAECDVPLPYDDDDISSVPEAIDDCTSDGDDESEVLSTPSLGRSSFGLLDPASIPLPEPSRLRHPRIFIEPEDINFYPFDFDPLPFPSEITNYQEC